MQSSQLFNTKLSEHKNQKDSAKKQVSNILQMHDRILELQNKWMGKGRFLIRNKALFLVNFFKYSFKIVFRILLFK